MSSGKQYEGIAALLRSRKDYDPALGYYKKSHAIYEQLLHAMPDDEATQQEVSYSHKHMGGTLAMQLSWVPALEHYRAAQKIDEAQLTLDPNNFDKRFNITFAYGDIGYVLSQQGKIDDALQYVAKALELRTALVAADPQNDRARVSLAFTLNSVGGLLERKQAYPGAVEAFTNSLATSEALVLKNPSLQDKHRDVAITQKHLASVYATMALHTKAPRDTAVNYCRQSLNLNRKSLPVLTQWNTQGKSGVRDFWLKEIEAVIADCERLVAARPNPVNATVREKSAP